jgi:hypothetical protein
MMPERADDKGVNKDSDGRCLPQKDGSGFIPYLAMVRIICEQVENQPKKINPLFPGGDFCLQKYAQLSPKTTHLLAKTERI